MRKIVPIALAASLGLGGVALVTPSLAQAQDSGTPSPAPSGSAADALADRVNRIKEALRGLVTDGTLNQEQADRVASTLAEQLPGRGGHGHGHGRGGHGPHAGRLAPAAVAEALGVTEDELRTALQSGKTLAQIGEDEGIAKADLIDKLVAAAKEQLAADVQAGRITQAQADQVEQGLEARITEKVDRTGRGFGRGLRPGGDRDGTSSGQGSPGLGSSGLGSSGQGSGQGSSSSVTPSASSSASA